MPKTPATKSATEPAAPKAPKYAVHPDDAGKTGETIACDEFGRSFDPTLNLAH